METQPTSFQLFKVGGIPIRVRGAFLAGSFLSAIFLFIAFPDSHAGESMVAAGVGVFLSVLVHELGHAMVAQRRGLRVREIEVHLLFAVTRTQAVRSPKEELLVALGGPLASLALASGGLALWSWAPPLPGPVGWQDLVLANLALGLVNLLPLFPMDGGRVLKALLEIRLGPQVALQGSVAIGRFLGVSLLLVPFLISDSWALVALPLGLLALVLGELERRRVLSARGESDRLGRSLGDDRV